MNVSVILGHPSRSSFNHAIAAVAVAQLRENDHQVYFHDLCEEHFDPVLPPEEIPKNTTLPSLIKQHCDEIARADGIIIIHPNWWGQPPAVLKGWIDRVLRPGVAYEFLEGDSGEGVPRGLLKAKTAVVFNTANTRDERERAVFGDPLELIWRNCIFGLCGIADVRRRTFGVVVTSTDVRREEWLNEARDLINRAFPKQ
ncbi:MAG TPA: NAD(P)H-dependent oxidoreductase [Nitrospirota bacterium]|nr:NAD(P)H-dependent oxidoreductase [Nitrospirota bacterium]